jgi:leader peptidase (prepilin peptidase) / N-methyltransferase
MITSFIVTIVALTLLGLCLGSFAGATVWRLRARQLIADKKEGEEVDASELKRLKPLAKGAFGRNDRSRCLHCGYELRWYDLLPLVSWLSLRGKCRSCHKRIGTFEPLIELGTATFFVGSFLLWPEPLTTPLAVTLFALWLLAGVFMAILFAYDAKWFLLPDVASFGLTIVGVAVSVTMIATSGDPLIGAINALTSVGVLSGIYLALYAISKGQWIGFGDVKLGVGLGLLLADWRLALIALFAANLVGTLIVLPGMIRGKLKSQTRIPFGPLLIIGTVIAKLGGLWVIETFFWTLFV